MNTDFSLDALLNGSTNNTSVTSPSNSKPSSTSTPTLSGAISPATTAQVAPQVTVSPSLITSTHVKKVLVTTKKRPSKRKRDEEEEKEEQKQEKDAQSKPRKKRVRTAYTKQQLQRLEFAFAQDPYPDMLMRENIAEELGLPDQKIHVWFQNRRAKLRKLQGQPTATGTTPVIGTSLVQCASSSPFTVTPTTLYHYDQPPNRPTNHSVAIQTRRSPSVLSPSPSPSQIHFGGVQTGSRSNRPTNHSLAIQTRRSPSVLSPSPSPNPIHFGGVQTGNRSWSTTPSVSPQSTPSVSPIQLQSLPSPPGNTLPPTYSFVLPTSRTSPASGPNCHGVTFPPPFPYYYSPRNSPQAPMYFLDMTPPLSGNSINSIVPPFPQFYHS